MISSKVLLLFVLLFLLYILSSFLKVTTNNEYSNNQGKQYMMDEQKNTIAAMPSLFHVHNHKFLCFYFLRNGFLSDPPYCIPSFSSSGTEKLSSIGQIQPTPFFFPERNQITPFHSQGIKNNIRVCTKNLLGSQSPNSSKKAQTYQSQPTIEQHH